MTHEYLATATFEAATGMPEDRIVNTFCIRDEGTTVVTDFGEITTAIHALYTVHATGGIKLSDLISNAVSRAAGSISYKIYDISGKLGGQPHGSPIFTDTGTLGGTGGQAGSLPTEVALAVTLRATGFAQQPVERPDGPDAGLLVDRPRSRYTGKVYLGPFADFTTEVVGGRVRPTATTRNVAVGAFQQMATALAARPNGPYKLCVWSRKDSLVRPVSQVEVDDAWDTQRRRGTKPTARQSAIFL